MAKPMKKHPSQVLSIGVITTLLIMGCHDDSNNNEIVSPEPQTPTTPEILTGSIVGTVVDQASLEPIANAVIKVGEQEYKSAVDGTFELKDLKVGDSILITMTAEDYPERSFTTKVSGTEPMIVEYQLSNDDTVVSVIQPVTEVISLTIADLGAQVSIPANALKRADGQPIVGNAIVTLDVVTPNIDPEEMPGGYGIVGGGFMESFGALILTATDSADNPLILVDGSTASIVIPVSTRSLETLATQMPLFFYNAELEGWVETGTATLQTLANGEQAYAANVDRIGPWNIDIAMETIEVIGCVADTDGMRVPNALIKGDGINYSAITTALSDSTGNFELPVRRDSKLYVYAQNGSRTSNAKPVTTFGTDYTIEDGCLTVSTENDNLSIRLTWGARPSDVDSHLLTPAGDIIDFRNQGRLSSAPFANLDVDDMNSFGPEFVTVRNLMVGRYRYGVHNYSRTKNPGLKESPVTVFLEGPTIRSRTLTPTIDDAENSSYFWHAFDLIVEENCQISYESVDKWLTDQETNATFNNVNSSEPTYCVSP